MKRKRIIALLKIQYKSLIRVPVVLCIILLLPIVLTLTFGLLFKSIIIEDTGQSVFEFLVPGLFAISGLFMAMPVSFSFSEDRELGLLKRINTTPLTATEFMGSHIISNMSMAFIQVVIIGILTFLMGYRIDGAITVMSLAFVFMAIFSISTIGFGLITATIAKNAKAAGGIVWIFILPQQMLASGLYPLPSGTEIISKFMPLHYASDGLTLLFNGAALSEFTIWGDLIILILFSLALVLIGILLFKKYGKV
ncbi:MAG: ABC transporter permease [Promethearchaeota archaeon]